MNTPIALRIKQVSDNSDAEPWLGGTRSRNSHSDRKYLHAVLSVASRHGGGLPRWNAAPRARFTGLRLGRGSAVAAALCMTDRHRAFGNRRAHVGIKIKRLHGKGFRAAQAHLRYIERDGVSRTGEPGSVYSATEDHASGREFLNRCRDDRHQFRITASAKDGDQYEDLKPLVRRFMSRVEDDLGTRLEWIAADHADTRHPHTHILLRGQDDCGNGLVIAPKYMCHGIGQRLAGIVSLDLGPATDTQRAHTLDLEVEAERVTSLDRRLLRAMDEEGAIAIASPDMVEHSALMGRLHKLGALGLASPMSGGRWRVSPDLEKKLRALGERSRRARILQQDLVAAGVVRALADRVVHDLEHGLDLSGRLVALGRNEESHRHYLIVDAVDGRSHYVETGNGTVTDSFSKDAIVRVMMRTKGGPESREPSVEVELLSSMSLHQLPHHDGATWLDRELVSPRLAPRDLGFGRELRSAMDERRTWLIEHGLVSTSDGRFTYRENMLELLERRELTRTAAVLARETKNAFAPIEPGSEFVGMVRRRIDLASGRYALVDNGYEFSLVPWQPTMEQALGKAVRATFGASGLAWTVCPEREIER